VLPKFATDEFCLANVYCVGVVAREAAHSDTMQAPTKAITEYAASHECKAFAPGPMTLIETTASVPSRS
jgi:ribosomal protein S12 methylthiotransferase accessory factor